MIRLAPAVRSLRPTEARPTWMEAACATGMTPTQRMTPAEMRRAILYMIALRRFCLPISLRNNIVCALGFRCDSNFGLFTTSRLMTSRCRGILERGRQREKKQRTLKKPADPDCWRQEQAERHSRGWPHGAAETKVPDQVGPKRRNCRDLDRNRNNRTVKPNASYAGELDVAKPYPLASAQPAIDNANAEECQGRYGATQCRPRKRL